MEEKTTRYAGAAALVYGEIGFHNQRGELLAVAISHLVVAPLRDAASRGKYRGEAAYPVYSADEQRQIAAGKAAGLELRGAEPRFFEDTGEGEPDHPTEHGPLWDSEIAHFSAGWRMGPADSVRGFPRRPEAAGRAFAPDPWTGGHTNTNPNYSSWEDRAIPRGFESGMQRMSWLLRAVTSWVGDDADLKRLKARLVRPNLSGDCTYYTGHVVAKRVEGGAHLIECELRAHDQLGRTNAIGDCTIALPFADLGADVYKVETRFTHDRSAAATMMAEQLNRGKLSVELDLNEEADRATFRELVRRCHVVAESYTPGVMERLGVTPEAVRAANPGAVMISVSAFGQSGPCVRFSGFAPSVEATSGMPSVTGYGDGAPRGTHLHYVDPLTGTTGTVATLAALLRSRADGAGSYVDMSLYEVAVAGVLERFVERELRGEEPAQLGNQDVFGGLKIVCPSSDPEIFVAVALSAGDGPRLSALPGLAEHGRPEDLERPLREWCSGTSAGEAVAQLRGAAIEAVVSYPVDQLVRDPHVLRRRAVIEIPSPDGAWRVLTSNQPLRFRGYEFDAAIQTPRLGEHTQQVLALIGQGRAMDWSDSPEQAAFRAEVRTLLDEKLPERYRAPGGNWARDRRSPDPEARRAARDWTDALAERNWFAPHWPEEYGGAGLSIWAQTILREEMAAAHAPPGGGPGVMQYGSTIILVGTEEQKREHLPRIVNGEELIQSGLSEPGAGSDLASLQTSALRGGDEYVVSGHKIWTSNGHVAGYLRAPVRTGSEAPKHRGISALLIPTDLAGVEFRPLINMGWQHGFNETFFDNARVPVRNRIGEENRGWYVGAMALDFERSGIAGSATVRRDVRELAGYLDSTEGRARARVSPVLRQQIADAAIAADVHYQLCLRIASMQAAGQVPNYEASIGKLFGTELTQRIARTAVSAFGLYSNL